MQCEHALTAGQVVARREERLLDFVAEGTQRDRLEALLSQNLLITRLSAGQVERRQPCELWVELTPLHGASQVARERLGSRLRSFVSINQ